jgi:hypothetical protein
MLSREGVIVIVALLTELYRSITLRKEYEIIIFEIGVPRRIFRPKRDEATGGWKNGIMRSYTIYILHQTLVG